ncbi:MAG: hypothetical protein JWO67_5408, partial [Streptosporangiaceae bacterium]|nr:hypothetical protein [Streptosporangiaceae bacterium]
MGGDTTITNEVLAERIANFRTDLHADLGRIEL